MRGHLTEISVKRHGKSDTASRAPRFASGRALNTSHRWTVGSVAVVAPTATPRKIPQILPN